MRGLMLHRRIERLEAKSGALILAEAEREGHQDTPSFLQRYEQALRTADSATRLRHDERMRERMHAEFLAVAPEERPAFIEYVCACLAEQTHDAEHIAAIRRLLEMWDRTGRLWEKG